MTAGILKVSSLTAQSRLEIRDGGELIVSGVDVAVAVADSARRHVLVSTPTGPAVRCAALRTMPPTSMLNICARIHGWQVVVRGRNGLDAAVPVSPAQEPPGQSRRRSS